MRGRLHVIEPSGKVRLVREYLDQAIDLDDLKNAVEGYIEIVPHFTEISIDGDRRTCIVFCNEDGKRLRMPVNDLATDMWTVAAGVPVSPDYLVGPIAVVTGDPSFLADV